MEPRNWTVAFQLFAHGKDGAVLNSPFHRAATMTLAEALMEAGDMNLVNYRNGGSLRYLPVPLPTVLS